MRNIFSKILISFFMLGIFLVPISANLNLQNALSPSVEIQTNTAEAWWGAAGNFSLWDAIVKPIGEGIGWTVAQVIKGFLFLIFQALALLASMLADILDFFIFYSIGSDVYRSTFVEAAWGTVRDVANIFFLLGLLYVAIQIVLDIGVSEKKKMIGNIIVMALLVNFSLFATQVVIDASNIVARVFYNQIESVDSTGKKLPEGKYLPKAVTVSLVSTFDPNKIISDQSSVYMDVLAYLIMVGIVGYMCYLFLVMTFLFVGRIVSLWVAMIFGPIAFMSRALGITALEDLSWKNWLHNLINSAMMAPLFIFFLYIILLLGKWIETLKKDIVIFSGQGDPFMAFITVLIPMAIIFTLLTKAKSLAIKYSGDIGKSLSSVGPALAGLALGGAALGTAALGRGTFGAVAKYSKKENDTSRNKDKNIRQNIKDKWNNSAWYQKAGLVASSVYGGGLAKIAGKGLAAKVAESFTTKTRDATTGAVTQRTGFGNMVADYKTKTHDSQIIQSKISEKADELHIDKTTKWADLTDDHKTEIKKSINQDIISKEIYGRKFSSLTNTDEIKAIKNANITDLGGGKMDYRVTDSKGSYSRQNQDNAEHIVSAANKNNGFSDIVGEATYSGAKGSWDIRNISKASSKELKSVVALLAGIAILLRGGLKKSNVEPGVGQKDFYKDLTEVITGAMKTAGAGAFASVAKEAAHKAGGHDDHGGGGHH